jgi:hypothetical protein
MRGNFAVESAASLLWNAWQLCYGISGNFAVELMATFGWNRWQLWRGIRTIVAQADFAVLELRGGTHLVLRPWEAPESGPVAFDIMVDDIDAAYGRIRGHGMDVTAITRGRIHDHFEVQTPDRRALTINSSHAGDRAV